MCHVLNYHIIGHGKIHTEFKTRDFFKQITSNKSERVKIINFFHINLFREHQKC